MILAIINQKGGVGKTTTAVTLASGFARHGVETLLVDLDAQGNCADALGDEKNDGLYQMLIGGEAQDAITFGVRVPHLDAVYGDKRTAEAKQILAGMPFREQKLSQVLTPLTATYEFIVLDVAPGIDVLQVSALVACTDFIIPVALDHLAVVGAADALASVAALDQAGAEHGRFLGVLPTMWERTTKESHAQLKALAGQFQRYVWPPIPTDVKAREAPAHGETLWEYAPSTRALVGVEMNGRRVGGYGVVLERLLFSE